MKIEVIVCTYMRPVALCKLLESVQEQTFVPDYVTIVDGSINDETGKAILQKNLKLNIRYHNVSDSERGLTRQRNFGIARIADDAELVAFLDDDTVLEPNYFEKISETFASNGDALGVGGYIVEDFWIKGEPPLSSPRFYVEDGWYRLELGRIRVRKALGLGPPHTPCFMPPESNGRSIGYIPPSGMTYPVEYFMGCAATYRRDVFHKVQFSEYFKGYGLYEDLDFCLRVSKLGTLYVNTAACLYHYHDPSGRPNRFQYGKMVIRNGWYVWRVKFGNPSLTARLKWWIIAIVQSIVNLNSVFRRQSRIAAITESVGRFSGMLSLVLHPPQVRR